MRVECEGGAAAWLEGTLAAPCVLGHGLPQPQELWLYQGLFFKPLEAGDEKASLASLSPLLCPFRHLEGSLAWGLSLCSVHQGHGEASLAGVLLCSSPISHLNGQPGWGPAL